MPKNFDELRYPIPLSMKFRKLVFYDLESNPQPKAFVDGLRKLADKVVVVYGDDDSGKLKPEHLVGADAFVSYLFDDFSKVLVRPELRLVVTMSTAYSQLPLEALKKRGVVVCNAGGFTSQGVTELAFAVLLTAYRQLPEALAFTRKGGYQFGKFFGRELNGKTIGIIGMGRIGSRIAGLAQGFGMRVVYFSKTRVAAVEKVGARFWPLAPLLKMSDVVALTYDLNVTSTGLLNPARVRLLKPGAFILNPIGTDGVHMPALYKRLKKGDLSMWIDHFHDKTWRDKCRKLPNVFITSDMGMTLEAIERNRAITLANVQAFLKGKPQNVVGG